jgi:cobalt-zinc-cadmium efflux system protein
MSLPHDHDLPRRDLSARGARRLVPALALVVTYMLVEVAGGLVSGSLALLADAGHMLSDAAALALALYAARVVAKPATRQRTWGHYRAEVLAALANGALLVAVALGILVEAVGRWRNPPHVEGGTMLGVAAGGLVVNLLVLRYLRPGPDASINERGARLHVLSDLLGSVQALLAAGAILAFGWDWVDPVASALIALLVVGSAWALLREAVGVLFESAPAHVDVDAVRLAMLAVPGVVEVHDLHVWTITPGLDALSAHVGKEPSASGREVLANLRQALRTRFGLAHLTIELGDGACEDVHLDV